MLMQSSSDSVIKIDNKQYLYFSGTSYYSLHSNKDVIDYSVSAINKYGLGSAVSRSTYGNTPLLTELEKSISQFFDTEDSVYLPSGYLSNLAGLGALKRLEQFEVIFIDEGSHYSVFDGANAMGVDVVTFKHCDYVDLERKLRSTNRKTLIATDGVFPLFGDIAPLNKYENLLKKHNTLLWVDDAHGVGVLGKNGRGTLDHHSITHNKAYFGATLSKAFGGYGGFISGDKNFIESIKNGDVVKGTNSMPISVMASSIKGIEILKNNPELRTNIWHNAEYLKSELKKIGINTADSNVPIIAWQMKTEEEMKMVKDSLFDKGIAIQFLQYSGSNGGALRIVTFSNHTKKQINLLVTTLKEALDLSLKTKEKI
jgi:7-keto-8-aminopelargonate synthetase-like enzyme